MPLSLPRVRTTHRPPSSSRSGFRGPAALLAAALALAVALPVAGAAPQPLPDLTAAAASPAPVATAWRYGQAYPSGLPAAATNTSAYSAPAVLHVGGAAPWIATGTTNGWVTIRNAADGGFVRDLYTGPGAVQASPAVVDWNRDGRPDLVAANLRGDLVVWDVVDGRELLRTLLFTDNWPTHVRGVFGTPAVADLDGDGWAEIVVTSWDHYLYVVNHDGSVSRKLFLKDTSWASPAVADVDGDGVPEIIAAWDCDANSRNFDCAYGSPGGFVGVFDRFLTLRWKQFMPGQAAWSSPAVGDVRGDGRAAIVMATGQMPCMMHTGAAGPCGNGSAIDTRQTGRRVYAFDGATGGALPGWPAVLPEKTMSSPALADVDGDGRLETFVATAGRLYRIDSSGAVRWGHSTCIALQKDPCGYAPLQKVDASPVVGELRGDGRQLVAVSYDFRVWYVDAVTGALAGSAEAPRAPGELSHAPGAGLTAATWGGRTWLYSAIMLCRADCYGSSPVWNAGTLVVDSGPAGRLLWSTFRGEAQRRGTADPASTAPSGAIGAYWNALGAAAGPLGVPLGPEHDVPGGRSQRFTHGIVYWSASTGAHSVRGGILARYLELGGPALLGLPRTDEQDGGVSGARASHFTAGSVYWSAATGAHAVRGAIHIRYLALGGPSGTMGLPTSSEVAGEVGGSRLSAFQLGRIYWSDGTGAQEVYGAILAHYLARGGPVRFGVPVRGEHSREGARAVETAWARFYWSPSGGVATISGAIRTHYDKVGGAAAYGLPVGDERPGTASGSAYSLLGAGEIHWSDRTGARAVRGGIRERWRATGGPTGPLGLPITDEQVGAVPGSAVSLFELGEIHWSPATGAWEVRGAIRGRWLASGGATGPLGLPRSTEYPVAGGMRSDFTGGSITWSATTGETTISRS